VLRTVPLLREPVVEGRNGSPRLLGPALGPLAFRRREGGEPVGPERLDHGRDDQPLDIGARRVMGAEAAPILGVERLFEQRPEDRGVDVAPVVPGGPAQFADLLGAQRQHLAFFEEGAVEAADLALDRIGEVAPVHRLPELPHHGHELRRLGLAALQHALERGLGQEPDILGEHGEEAAHEEHGHLLGREAFRFQRLRHGGEALRDGAGDAGGVARRVERGRIGPDADEALAHGRVPQVVEVDPEASAVRELVVDLPVAAEVGVDLEAVADVADDEKRRRIVADRQQPHVGFGLLARIDHEHVPGPVGAPPPLVGGRNHEERQLPDDLVAGTLQAGLLGLEDEAAAPVEVDARMGDRAVAVDAPDGALEDVVVALRRGAGGLGPRQPKRVAELDQEQAVIGPLLPALAALPPPDEGVDRVGARDGRDLFGV